MQKISSNLLFDVKKMGVSCYLFKTQTQVIGENSSINYLRFSVVTPLYMHCNILAFVKCIGFNLIILLNGKSCHDIHYSHE